MQRRQPIRPDPEHCTNGGWKVHLTIGPNSGPNSYKRRVSAVDRWLSRNIERTKCPEDWKYLKGGDQYEKDFTVYLGSYETMIAFVNALEKDPIVKQLDASNAGPADRIVGASGKVSARFDPQGKEGGKWTYGWNGIPFALQDWRLTLTRPAQEAAERSRAALKAIYGDYFLPESID